MHRARRIAIDAHSVDAVVLRDEVTRREFAPITDGSGAFTVASLHDGVYRVEVTLEGFKPAVLEHLLLKQNEITRAQVALRIDSTGVTIGIIVVQDPMSSEGISTTFSQELINKLPI